MAELPAANFWFLKMTLTLPPPCKDQDPNTVVTAAGGNENQVFYRPIKFLN